MREQFQFWPIDTLEESVRRTNIFIKWSQTNYVQLDFYTSLFVSIKNPFNLIEKVFRCWKVFFWKQGNQARGFRVKECTSLKPFFYWIILIYKISIMQSIKVLKFIKLKPFHIYRLPKIMSRIFYYFRQPFLFWSFKCFKHVSSITYMLILYFLNIILVINFSGGFNFLMEY